MMRQITWAWCTEVTCMNFLFDEVCLSHSVLGSPSLCLWPDLGTGQKLRAIGPVIHARVPASPSWLHNNGREADKVWQASGKVHASKNFNAQRQGR